MDGEMKSYPLFVGGGAGYWKPSHGSYTTFWNIRALFENGFGIEGPILLNGMGDGPNARLYGVHGNRPVRIEYGPGAIIKNTNEKPEYPSLFEKQLEQRLENRK